jgi:two-component system phosphate regulon sensor histidine kinase PhoR
VSAGLWVGISAGLTVVVVFILLRLKAERTREALDQQIALLEEALANERDRFDAVMEGMEAGVIVLDEAGRIVLLNGAASSFTQPQSGEGSPIHEALPASGLDRFLSVLKDEQSATSQLEMVGPPARTLLARAAKQRSSGGVVLVLHDVTELQRLDQVRQTFVANVSHELRTPLSVIRANTEALLGGALEDAKASREFLGATQRHAERLSLLISDLLDLSRIEAGQLDLQVCTFPLQPVVQRVLEAAGPLAEGRGIELHCRVPHLTDVRADVSALEQVVLNLVENAVKYGREEGAVWVSAEPVDGGVRILVKDDGPGIDACHHDRLFERFYRVDVGRSREVGGTGLGLAIVKHLVTGMGGHIGIRPREPEGTVFWVQLPE